MVIVIPNARLGEKYKEAQYRVWQAKHGKKAAQEGGDALPPPPIPPPLKRAPRQEGGHPDPVAKKRKKMNVVQNGTGSLRPPPIPPHLVRTAPSQEAVPHPAAKKKCPRKEARKVLQQGPEQARAADPSTRATEPPPASSAASSASSASGTTKTALEQLQDAFQQCRAETPEAAAPPTQSAQSKRARKNTGKKKGEKLIFDDQLPSCSKTFTKTAPTKVTQAAQQKGISAEPGSSKTTERNGTERLPAANGINDNGVNANQENAGDSPSSTKSTERKQQPAPAVIKTEPEEPDNQQEKQPQKQPNGDKEAVNPQCIGNCRCDKERISFSCLVEAEQHLLEAHMPKYLPRIASFKCTCGRYFVNTLSAHLHWDTHKSMKHTITRNYRLKINGAHRGVFREATVKLAQLSWSQLELNTYHESQKDADTLRKLKLRSPEVCNLLAEMKQEERRNQEYIEGLLREEAEEEQRPHEEEQRPHEEEHRDPEEVQERPAPKKPRGRPPGSKNKKQVVYGTKARNIYRSSATETPAEPFFTGLTDLNFEGQDEFLNDQDDGLDNGAQESTSPISSEERARRQIEKANKQMRDIERKEQQRNASKTPTKRSTNQEEQRRNTRSTAKKQQRSQHSSESEQQSSPTNTIAQLQVARTPPESPEKDAGPLEAPTNTSPVKQRLPPLPVPPIPPARPRNTDNLEPVAPISQVPVAPIPPARPRDSENLETVAPILPTQPRDSANLEPVAPIPPAPVAEIPLPSSAETAPQQPPEIAEQSEDQAEFPQQMESPEAQDVQQYPQRSASRDRSSERRTSDSTSESHGRERRRESPRRKHRLRRKEITYHYGTHSPPSREERNHYENRQWTNITEERRQASPEQRHQTSIRDHYEQVQQTRNPYSIEVNWTDVNGTQNERAESIPVPHANPPPAPARTSFNDFLESVKLEEESNANVNTKRGKNQQVYRKWMNEKRNEGKENETGHHFAHPDGTHFQFTVQCNNAQTPNQRPPHQQHHNYHQNAPYGNSSPFTVPHTSPFQSQQNPGSWRQPPTTAAPVEAPIPNQYGNYGHSPAMQHQASPVYPRQPMPPPTALQPWSNPYNQQPPLANQFAAHARPLQNGGLHERPPPPASAPVQAAAQYQGNFYNNPYAANNGRVNFPAPHRDNPDFAIGSPPNRRPSVAPKPGDQRRRSPSPRRQPPVIQAQSGQGPSSQGVAQKSVPQNPQTRPDSRKSRRSRWDMAQDGDNEPVAHRTRSRSKSQGPVAARTRSRSTEEARPFKRRDASPTPMMYGNQKKTTTQPQ